MKQNTGLLALSLCIATLFIAGCASQPKAPSDQILKQHPSIARLSSEIDSAKAKSAALLAPQSYELASESLQSALKSAEKNDTESLQEETATGMSAIKKLNSDVENSHQLLSEVLQARDRAHAAGVKTLEKDKIEDLDQELKKTAALIEDGKLEQAKKRRPKLLEGYTQLELMALKQGTANLARSSIDSAREQGAEKYAPKTLTKAEESLALATTILDNDRTQTDKADLQARKAKWLADQSAAITETIKDFNRRDYSLEDIVLWHQLQLSQVNQPLGGELAFNQSNSKAVQDLRDAVFNLVNEKDLALENSRLTEQKLARQLALSEKERQSEQLKEREYKRKFEQVQAMFNGNEANVYRQREDILISAHGFQFASGQSEILTVNFQLMSKITQAIKLFPEAQIQVSGHTDATGDDAINQIISEARALKVAKFLVDLGGIQIKNITARGYGETRPVASNDTFLGRAENRRVEIKIMNK